MEQIDFFPISNPSNIYGLARLPGKKNRILVATLENQIVCIEYVDNKFTCNEVHFAYIPNGADIISIDTYAKSSNSNDVVVGITFFKNSKESDSKDFRKNITLSNNSKQSSNSDKIQTRNHYYFNIYSSLISMNRFDLNQIAQDCQTFELDFVPFQLYHTRFFDEQSFEIIWLLSGSDCCIHVFREDIKKQCFYKEKIDLFPELIGFKSIVLWIDIMNIEHAEQHLTAVGFEDGSVQLALVKHQDPSRPEIVKLWKTQFDGPVLSVRIFKDQSDVSFNKSFLKDMLDINAKPQDIDLNFHLLVANSYETPVVYRNVQTKGLTEKKMLPGTGKIDILMTTLIGDFNFDGYNEILLGTYEKELIEYEFNRKIEQYFIKYKMKLPYPIQAISYSDLTGNGINELIVVTSKGVVIQRHKLDEMMKILLVRVNKCLTLLNK